VRRFIYGVAIIAVGALPSASTLPALGAQAAPPSAFAMIAPAVNSEIASGHVPGAVVLVGDQGGVLYRQAFGARMLQPEQAAMTEDTIFDLASLTKVIATTTAVMQLVDARRLQLEAPVAKYWPSFAAHGKAGITIEQLLTHSSGLRADLDLHENWSGALEARLRVEAERPQYAPGTKFLYSDINFIALAELVERVTGQSFQTYVVRHIFDPLGMKDTGFLPAQSLRSRIAPTDIEEGGLRWGEVQDPTARRMGGVAGHAGLFGTANDLALFAQMLLHGGDLNGTRILSTGSVARLTAPHSLVGNVLRGLGWDIRSPYGGGEDSAFGTGSYGHTGYSGTSLWIDPKRSLYLIILTSRLHPEGKGDVKPLRRNVAELVAAGTPIQAAASVAHAVPNATVMTGIDVLEHDNFRPLTGKRVALLTNQTGRDAAGRRTIDVLANTPEVHLTALFSPEHGLGADREGRIPSATEPLTGLPVYSLYGKDLRPSPAAFAQFDALVIDLQDVGVRFFTYATTMAYAMEAAAQANIPVIVLDRPDPLTANVVEGPVLEAQRRSFTGYFPMPVQHGMTFGELATMFNTEASIGAKLSVIAMRAYRRGMWFDETGLPWIAPSPNLHSLAEAILYPGVGLLESANLSVGRGTANPFELIGAPWIDGKALARLLNERHIPGVRFEGVDFTPSDDRYTRLLCHGVRISVTDRNVFRAPELGIELAAAIYRLYPAQFRLKDTLSMIGSRPTLDAITEGLDPRRIVALWQDEIESFKLLRSKYLLY
jgi:uncharacterized protein YbbC (DUF1343 family)/CubicO group peptidase (beta-lactamase class C family)